MLKAALGMFDFWGDISGFGCGLQVVCIRCVVEVMDRGEKIVEIWSRGWIWMLSIGRFVLNIVNSGIVLENVYQSFGIEIGKKYS